MVSTALPILFNTKIYRLIRYAADHLIQFGCSRRLDTDQN